MKKIKKHENRAGIWIDQTKAVIVHIVSDGDPIIEKIRSGVESKVRFPGETKVFARFGNAFISDQEKKQHRQKNEREKYFKKIISLLKQTDFIYVFGPSDARHELVNDIQKDPVLKNKFIKTEKVDRLTEKQILRHVVNYFSGEDFIIEKTNQQKLLATH